MEKEVVEVTNKAKDAREVKEVEVDVNLTEVTIDMVIFLNTSKCVVL